MQLAHSAGIAEVDVAAGKPGVIGEVRVRGAAVLVEDRGDLLRGDLMQEPAFKSG